MGQSVVVTKKSIMLILFLHLQKKKGNIHNYDKLLQISSQPFLQLVKIPLISPRVFPQSFPGCVRNSSIGNAESRRLLRFFFWRRRGCHCNCIFYRCYTRLLFRRHRRYRFPLGVLPCELRVLFLPRLLLTRLAVAATHVLRVLETTKYFFKKELATTSSVMKIVLLVSLRHFQFIFHCAMYGFFFSPPPRWAPLHRIPARGSVHCALTDCCFSDRSSSSPSPLSYQRCCLNYYRTHYGLRNAGNPLTIRAEIMML